MPCSVHSCEVLLCNSINASTFERCLRKISVLLGSYVQFRKCCYLQDVSSSRKVSVLLGSWFLRNRTVGRSESPNSPCGQVRGIKVKTTALCNLNLCVLKIPILAPISNPACSKFTTDLHRNDLPTMSSGMTVSSNVCHHL